MTDITVLTIKMPVSLRDRLRAHGAILGLADSAAARRIIQDALGADGPDVVSQSKRKRAARATPEDVAELAHIVRFYGVIAELLRRRDAPPALGEDLQRLSERVVRVMERLERAC